MPKLIDLSGERFGRLVVIKRIGTRATHPLWLCKCDCGNYAEVTTANLRSGASTSCGCYKVEVTKKIITKHGESYSRIYHIWKAMRRRCNIKDCKDYKYYGGRGISVCDEWENDFAAFREWALANGYQEWLSIDRIDVNGDYCPENCRWASTYEQNNNKRTSKYISFNGKTGTVREFADKYGISYSCLYARLKLGWSIEDALLTPLSRKDLA